VIARTDAESGRLISSNIDPTDHEFILGTTTPGKALAEILSEADARGASGAEVDSLETGWTSQNELVTFDEGLSYIIGEILVSYSLVTAVRRELEAAGKVSAFDEYKSLAGGKSNPEARVAARQILGKDIFWDWDCKSFLFPRIISLIPIISISVPRTKEGFYHTTGGVEAYIVLFSSRFDTDKH